MKGHNVNMVEIFNTEMVLDIIGDQLFEKYDGDGEKVKEEISEYSRKCGEDIAKIYSMMKSGIPYNEIALDNTFFITDSENGDTWLNMSIINLSEFARQQEIEGF